MWRQENNSDNHDRESGQNVNGRSLQVDNTQSSSEASVPTTRESATLRFADTDHHIRHCVDNTYFLPKTQNVPVSTQETSFSSAESIINEIHSFESGDQIASLSSFQTLRRSNSFRTPSDDAPSASSRLGSPELSIILQTRPLPHRPTSNVSVECPHPRPPIPPRRKEHGLFNSQSNNLARNDLGDPLIDTRRVQNTLQDPPLPPCGGCHTDTTDSSDDNKSNPLQPCDLPESYLFSQKSNGRVRKAAMPSCPNPPPSNISKHAVRKKNVNMLKNHGKHIQNNNEVRQSPFGPNSFSNRQDEITKNPDKVSRKNANLPAHKISSSEVKYYTLENTPDLSPDLQGAASLNGIMGDPTCHISSTSSEVKYYTLENTDPGSNAQAPPSGGTDSYYHTLELSESDDHHQVHSHKGSENANASLSETSGAPPRHNSGKSGILHPESITSTGHCDASGSRGTEGASASMNGASGLEHYYSSIKSCPPEREQDGYYVVQPVKAQGATPRNIPKEQSTSTDGMVENPLYGSSMWKEYT